MAFQVGKITKQWTGLAKEMFTDADNFGINFPLDLDVKVCVKILLTTWLMREVNFRLKLLFLGLCS